MSAIIFAVSSILLFARLGHYALWDDEAITALTAKGVWQTGDTSAVIGHNLVAFRNGLLLRNLKDRATSPLQFYLAAPFVGMLGDSSLAARMPFALCGLGCIALILWWLHRDDASVMAWLLVGLAIVGHVSFFLFSRQARYYGLAMLLVVAVAYAYFHVQTRQGLIVHTLLSVLLLMANYMTFAAVMSMLAVDYLLWGRRRLPLRGWDWVILIAPPLLIGAVVVSVWNPLRIAEPRTQFSWIQWHTRLLWWNLRDQNSCEFGSGALLLAAPVVAALTRWALLMRAVVALLVAIIVISIITPQNPSDSMRADVRYLSFLIPLCMAIGVMTILPLARSRCSSLVAIAIACVAFGSNLLNFSFITDQPVRSTIYKYARELIRPVPEPYTPVARWIRQNVPAGESIFVLPDYMMYPLMFHAPNALYAWQLNQPPPPELANLPKIHIKMVVPPDWLIAFGPGREVLGKITFEARYEQVHQIDVFWRDLYRPELFWRAFEAPAGFDRSRYAVYIFRRVREPSSFRL